MAPRERLSRKESKEQTRSEVLHAARRLFLRDGFVATSLSAIAEEAAVTKGAVYSNFESKEDLFLSIVRELQQRESSEEPELSISRWDDLAGGTGIGESLATLGRDLEANLPELRQVALFLEYNVFALRNPRSRAWVADHNADYFSHAGAAIDEAIAAAGGSEGGRSELFAMVAQSLLVGLLLHQAIDPERFDGDVFAAAFGALGTLLEPDT